MLRLTLIRHANAEWKDASYEDFDRPLNKRGLAEAESIGKVLLENLLVPDLILASTARRTQQTSEIVARMLGVPARRVKSVEQLYLARDQVILATVGATGPKVGHLALIGHNPGISDLARFLAPADSEIGEMATASAVTLTFVAESWDQVETPASHAVQYQPTRAPFGVL